VSEPRPFTIIPLDGPTPTWPEDLSDGASYPRRLVYDRETGTSTFVDSSDGVVWAEWLGDSRLLVRLGSYAGIYDAESGSWSVIELGFDLGLNSSAFASPDGSRIAVEGPDGRLVLVDMRAMTYRTLDLVGREYVWSPDSTRLLVLEQDNRRQLALIDVSDPTRPVRVPEEPLISSPNRVAWLDLDRVAVVDGNPASILVVSLGASPQTVLRQPVEEGQVSLSPDGNHFAVSRSGFQVSDEFTSRLTFHSLDPFALVAAYDGFAMHEHGATAWTADGSRVVALRDPCSDNETLIVLDIVSGAQTDLAPVGTSQLAFSPDGASVAYAASPGEAASLFIVPADGSAPPEAVFHLSGAYGAVSNPQWSSDGRFISFGLGGFGRCP
jgi:WD40 repeat protein